MTQPEGFVDPDHPHHVCKLSKSIYGLKKSPRAWFLKLSFAIVEWEFLASQADTSLFIYRSVTVVIILLIYVDDIIVTGFSDSNIVALLSFLNTKFVVKDLGSLYFFLGIQVHRSTSGLHLSQTKYVFDLLTKTQLLNLKLVTTPMALTHLSLYDGEPHTDVISYRSLIGALQYYTLTRPDISFLVNKLCQFLHVPTSVHYQGAKRVIHYLKGMAHLDILLIPLMNFIALLMLIGHCVSMIDGVLVPTVFIWVITSFHGLQQNRKLFLVLVPCRNTTLLPMSHMKFCGCNLFLGNLAFLFRFFQLFIVIT
uniref:Reverse transcriptase Ty1/copia-type domain-containing protein n=1 Tax=Cannabis sativa TaxID=3483 RepID=A0A803Q1K7_CANSA